MKSMKIMKFARKPWKFHDFRTPGPPKMTHFWTPFLTLFHHFELLLPQAFIRNPKIWATPKKCLKTWHFWTPLKKWDVIKMGFLADDRFLSPFFTVLTNLRFWPFWIFKRHFFTVLAILAILAFSGILAKTVFQNDPTFCRMILQQTKGAPLPLKLVFWRGVQKWGHFGTPFLTPFFTVLTGPHIYMSPHWYFGLISITDLSESAQKWSKNGSFLGTPILTPSAKSDPKIDDFGVTAGPPKWVILDPFFDPFLAHMSKYAYFPRSNNTGLIQGVSKRVPKCDILGVSPDFMKSMKFARKPWKFHVFRTSRPQILRSRVDRVDHFLEPLFWTPRCQNMTHFGSFLTPFLDPLSDPKCT